MEKVLSLTQIHRPKILFLALLYPDVEYESGLYPELVEELSLGGSDICVVAPAVDTKSVGMRKEGDIHVLRVATGPLFAAHLLRKGINNLLLPLHFYLAIRKHLRLWDPDWIIMPTPPITLMPLVWWLKRQTKAKSYLILRDIFPQNAVDLGLISRVGPIFYFFRLLEKWSYAIAEQIGCMSPGNIQYVLMHNPSINPAKLHLLPNWIAERHLQINADRVLSRCFWNIQEGDLLCVFGGNLGKPQNVGFLVDVAEALKKDEHIHIVIVGSGSESASLKRMLELRKLSNLSIKERLARNEYQQLLSAADFGIILLNAQFTIPNIPSRLTGYWAAGLPVLAATDVNTDLNESFLARHQGGDWVLMGDAEAFAEKLRWYANESKKRTEMGIRGQQAIKNHYTAKKVAQSVLSQMALANKLNTP